MFINQYHHDHKVVVLLVHCIAAEATYTQRFFQLSALTKRPIRHQFHEAEHFVPTYLKRAKLHGSDSRELYSRFGINERHTVGTHSFTPSLSYTRILNIIALE